MALTPVEFRALVTIARALESVLMALRDRQLRRDRVERIVARLRAALSDLGPEP